MTTDLRDPGLQFFLSYGTQALPPLRATALTGDAATQTAVLASAGCPQMNITPEAFRDLVLASRHRQYLRESVHGQPSSSTRQNYLQTLRASAHAGQDQ